MTRVYDFFVISPVTYPTALLGFDKAKIILVLTLRVFLLKALALFAAKVPLSRQVSPIQAIGWIRSHYHLIKTEESHLADNPIKSKKISTISQMNFISAKSCYVIFHPSK